MFSLKQFLVVEHVVYISLKIISRNRTSLFLYRTSKAIHSFIHGLFHKRKSGQERERNMKVRKRKESIIRKLRECNCSERPIGFTSTTRDTVNTRIHIHLEVSTTQDSFTVHSRHRLYLVHRMLKAH